MKGVQLAAVLTIVLTAAPARAQSSPVGVRAAGMGDAFTAVADDATATYWNPAGLASGALFGLTLDANVLDRQSGQFAGLATPPFGISYFRTTSSTGEGENGRNGAVGTFVVHHAGATVVQSIGDSGVAIGATLGIVHGNGATGFGADAGVMFAGELGKIGVVAHNLAAPELGGIRLDRQVRAGVSVHARDDLTVAADVDLTSAAAPTGRGRELALGAESHPTAKVWARGGVHWDVGSVATAPVGTVGGSVALYGTLRADAQASFGSKEGDRGWGVGLSYVY